MKDAKTLLEQFRKGLAYFGPHEIATANPIIKRQAIKFEAEVIRPLDAACATMSKKQRAELEAQDVSF